MRSVNVTYKIYEFSELSEDAKAKVKKWYLDNFYQNEEFSDKKMVHYFQHKFYNLPQKKAAERRSFF